jgi:uncharacterized protein
MLMSSAQVAKIGWDGLLTGKRVVIPGVKNALLTQALRLAPRTVIARISANLNASS